MRGNVSAEWGGQYFHPPLDPLPSREGKSKVIDCGEEVGVIVKTRIQSWFDVNASETMYNCKGYRKAEFRDSPGRQVERYSGSKDL